MANTLKFGNGNWATKEDSVLAYNDENNNFKPLPFDFTRASTATYVDSDGLIKTARNGEARIDYTDSSDGALLLEPQRSNLITYSQEFSNASWVKSNGGVGSNPIVTPNYTSSPLKGYMADRVIFNLNGGNTSSDLSTLQSNTFNLTVGQNITYYMAVKTNDGSTVDMTLNSNLGNTKIKSITPEWTIIKTSTTATATASGVLRLRLRGSELVSNYADISIAYAQLEQGSYATSYIPTSGSTVTRIAETASGSGNSEVFNDSEGVLFADIAALSNDLTYRQISIKEEVGAGDILTIDLSSANNGVRSYLRVNGSAVSLNATLGNETLYNKIAVKYGNTHSLWINGFEVKSQTLTLLPISLDKVRFDNGVGASKFFGKTKEIAYYNTALTDIELEELTSYRSWVSMVNALKLNIIYNG